MDKLRSRIKKLIGSGACERAYIKRSRYRENFRILLDGGTMALVQIGPVDTVRQKGGIRIDCNPAKFAPGDTRKIHRVMRSLVGHHEYKELMQSPLLKVFHVAVDVHHASLTRMLVLYKNAQRMTMFAKRIGESGLIEGYNFGSVNSNYQTAAYNKSQELVHAAIMEIAKTGVSGFREDPLKANKITQLKKLTNGVEIVRIEVRGKKMLGLPLWKLPAQTNRFARFRFADLAATDCILDPLTERAVLAMCRQDGVKAALNAFKHTKKSRKVHAFLRSRQAAWWQPDALWQQAFDALRETGMFPPDAFIEPSEHVAKPAP